MSHIITLSNATAGYDGRPQIKDVNLRIDRSDFIGIVGPNGGGKTTMLRLILKLLPPMEGRVSYWREGNEVKRLDIGYLPQYNNIDREFPISVAETVLQGLNGKKPLFRSFNAEHRRKAAMALQRLDIADLARDPIRKLSGGQLQRVLFARAIVGEPEVLVLDEPLSYVDKSFEARLYQIIADLAKHTTIILVSHDISVISQMANRHIIIDGSVHECKAAHHFVRSDCR